MQQSRFMWRDGVWIYNKHLPPSITQCVIYCICVQPADWARHTPADDRRSVVPSFLHPPYYSFPQFSGEPGLSERMSSDRSPYGQGQVGVCCSHRAASRRYRWVCAATQHWAWNVKSHMKPRRLLQPLMMIPTVHFGPVRTFSSGIQGWTTNTRQSSKNQSRVLHTSRRSHTHSYTINTDYNAPDHSSRDFLLRPDHCALSKPIQSLFLNLLSFYPFIFIAQPPFLH